MDVKNLSDLSELLARRDDISLNEAWNLIDECKTELNNMLYDGTPSIIEAENIVAEYLGLEPDYLDLLLP